MSDKIILMPICTQQQNESPNNKTIAPRYRKMHPTSAGGYISYLGNLDLFWHRSRQWSEISQILHIPGCICRFELGFCRNIKKRTETLYQSFSPFLANPVDCDTRDGCTRSGAGRVHCTLWNITGRHYYGI